MNKRIYGMSNGMVLLYPFEKNVEGYINRNVFCCHIKQCFSFWDTKHKTEERNVNKKYISDNLRWPNPALNIFFYWKTMKNNFPGSFVSFYPRSSIFFASWKLNSNLCLIYFTSSESSIPDHIPRKKIFRFENLFC